MPDEVPDQPETPTTESPEPEWRRQRRLAAIFGDVLPDTTSDERDPENPAGDSPSEAWLKAQVPPHHGG
ncbi:hypothetical protein BH09ACT12_BH09ACT12_21680 [soil metagenome]